MKGNRKLLLGILCIMAFVLAGCVRMEESIVVDENNKITMGSELAFNKAETDERMGQGDSGLSPAEVEAMMAEDMGCVVKTIDGEEYYVQSESTEITEAELEEKYPTYLITKDKFFCYGIVDGDEGTDDSTSDSMGEMGLSPEDVEYCVLRVKLPSEVVKTNGTTQEDKQTVEWDIKDAMFSETGSTQEIEYYAYTANDPGNIEADREIIKKRIADPTTSDRPITETPVTPTISPNVTPSATPDSGRMVHETKTSVKDKKAPVIKGVKKNKKYKKKATVYVKDNVKIKKVLLNGKKVKLKKVSKGKYKGYYKFTVKKKGKCTVAAYDTSGNCKKIKFRIK